jgi:hypothetical protein
MQLANTPEDASYNDEKNECQCYTHNIFEFIPLKLFRYIIIFGKVTENPAIYIES